MSDYQATWILDSDDDESGSEYSGDEVCIKFFLIQVYVI